MSNEIDDVLDDKPDNKVETQNNKPETLTDDSKLTELVSQRVEAALKDIKGKLDKAYNARDEANRKAAEAEAKLREAEVKRLQDEGKHKEALELQLEEERNRLAEERARREAVERRNIELSRDSEVRSALIGTPFRSERAARTAFREIVDELVVDEQGVWKHKSGTLLNDFVKAFLADEDNSYLLKPKASTGGGTSNMSGGTNTDTSGKSLFQRSQAEVLKMAAEGKLPNQRK